MPESQQPVDNELTAPYLAGLNPPQLAAVKLLDGPVLVLAGAGTGKTRVLTTRLAHLLHERKARPWNVLAVTFTNRAAQEMRTRVAAMVGESADAIWLGTFHAIGVRILRRHAELLDLKPNFTILDEDDQIRLLKQVLVDKNIDERKWPPRVLLSAVQRWKDRGLVPDEVPAADESDLAGGRLGEIYAAYQSRLTVLNAVDFGDLLLHCLTLFRTHNSVLAEYQQRFHYILVDEYQDTNFAQYLLLRLLAQTRRNIACVGDDDQSIYAWRGAEVGNILRFESDFPGAKVIRLEQNYRSTPHILGAASGLISKNDGRLGKTLWSAETSGEKVTVTGVWDGQEEARRVGNSVESLQDQDTRLSEIAILVRAGFQTREFEERFLTLGVPYRVVGGPRFYERQEIRDAIAYLRVVNQPSDDLAFARIINKPRRGIGDATLRVLYAAARVGACPLTQAARSVIDTVELKPRPRQVLTDLLADFQRWRAMAESLSQTELATALLDESGYISMLQNDRSPEAPGRLENLKELVSAMAEFENLSSFLEHVSLVMENVDAAGSEMVSIMTLHSAKGLEFDTVFLPGWEEGLFPHRRSLEENGAMGLEEERRLAYVGLTRARRHARVFFAANRKMYGGWVSAIPSRFVDDLPEAHVELSSDTGLYRGEVAEAGPTYVGHSLNTSRGVQGHSPVLDGGLHPAARSTASNRNYTVGERVFHQKFGYGTVRTAEHNKLEIIFEKAGMKKVLDRFVIPADTV